MKKSILKQVISTVSGVLALNSDVCSTSIYASSKTVEIQEIKQNRYVYSSEIRRLLKELFRRKSS